MRNKVFVSGCFDILNAGHVAFLKAASEYGDLYVGLRSDASIRELKSRTPVCPESERLYMVKAIRYVTDAYINDGFGLIDFGGTVDRVKPDIMVVNTLEECDAASKFCEERGIRLVSLHDTGSHTAGKCRLPYRVDLAGTWIDQPYVSKYGPGWAITVSIEPTVEFMERGGMSTSTRNAAKKIWPLELPQCNEESLARLLFCFENAPENIGHVSGAQDAIGICMSGLVRHYYDNHYWPTCIESCHDEDVLSWIERHVCLVPMFPRRPGCSVVDGKDINPYKVKALTSAAERCWDAIMKMDLDEFAKEFLASFEAQVEMFPAMMQPGVQEHIDYWHVRGALAWKMCGAGGGGHLALVVDEVPNGAIPIKIRR